MAARGTSTAGKTSAPRRSATRRKAAVRRPSRGNAIFKIDMLPADHGDCLIVTYGKGRRLSRVLIDCGTTSTVERLQARLRTLRPRIQRFDLFVLTHIDADHIGGSIDFFNEGAAGLSFDDVWFNGWKHLPRRRLSAKVLARRTLDRLSPRHR